MPKVPVKVVKKAVSKYTTKGEVKMAKHKCMVGCMHVIAHTKSGGQVIYHRAGNGIHKLHFLDKNGNLTSTEDYKHDVSKEIAEQWKPNNKSKTVNDRVR